LPVARWIDVVRLRIRSLVHRDRADRELDEEFAYHRERLIDAYMSRGMTRPAAEHAAAVEMTGSLQRKEECRDVRRVRIIEEFFEDSRFGVRQFRKNPGFTAVVLTVLALAIGGNAAIFGIARAVLAPLEIPRSDRVVIVWTEAPTRNWHHFPASMADIRDWQASGVFASLAAFTEDGFNVRLPDRTDRVQGLRITASFFQVLSVAVARGRSFDDRSQPADHEVVLSDRLWRSLFAADPEIVGRPLTLDGTVHTVIGVLPPRGPRFGKEDLYVLFPPSVQESTERGSRGFGAIGRLRDDLGLAAARLRMLDVSLDLAARFPKEDGGLSAALQPIQEAQVQDSQLLLGVLMGAVACVLAVACANIASLLLAKSLTRGRELAIRAAIGGDRWRLTRQLITENLLLAVGGGGISILPASWLMTFIASYQLDELPNAGSSGLDFTVLSFTFLVAVVTGLLCSLVPALLIWRRDLNAQLKANPNADSGATPHRLRASFVVGQVALTAVLLVVGGLTLRSFLRVLTDSPGYNPAGVLTMRIALSDTHYADEQMQAAFFNRVLDRARALPGVVSAAAVRELPTSDDFHGSGMIFPKQPEPRIEDIPLALRTSVLVDYFKTMQIPLVSGRVFTAADTKDSPTVAVIDEWSARQYWPGQSAVGQRFKTGRTQPWREVIGVVGDVESPLIVRLLKGRVGQVYLPYPQESYPRMNIVLRSAGDPSALAASMRRVVTEIDRDQSIFAVQTLDEVRAAGQKIVRLVTIVLSAFALMALLLAIVGLYGTVAYDVSERTREFGLRMSLGAPRLSILTMVLKRGSVLLIAGAALGFVGALAAARLVSGLISGVQPGDLTTFGVVALLLAASGLVAIFLPAKRATAIDPLVALKCD